MSKKRTSAKNYFDYIVLFVLNAAEMILELVAARLLSPYFGSSNFVWTAIIGIILLAMSLGNVIGGEIASRKNHRYWAGMLLLFASIYIAITPVINVPILEHIKAGNTGTEWAAIISSIIFFLIPSTILGIITPIIMKERIGDSQKKGEESGRITSISAIGSLVGTFLGGFLLIPALGTKAIFVLLGAIIIPATILFVRGNIPKEKRYKAVYLLTIMATICISALSIATVISKNDAGVISIDTEYGRIILEEDDGVLYYRQSGAYSSATFLDENRKFELVFDYMKKYDIMFNFLDAKNTAMIGGAGYQYPKYFISHFQDKAMDVIEIDPVSTDIAKKYFFLDDLLKTYGEERIGLYNEDGRVYLSNTDKKYDAILNDSFSGEVPVGTMATVEAAKTIRQRLNPGGVYMSNTLGAISGDKGRFLRSEVKTLGQVFSHVYVVPVKDSYNPESLVNWMVIATDNNRYQPENLIEIKYEDADIVLTDDYCPSDSLISTYYYD